MIKDSLITALILFAWAMHDGQADMTVLNAFGICRAVGVFAWILCATGTEFDVGIFQSRTFGNTRTRIGLSVAAAHGHIMRRTITRQTSVRLIGDARNATLSLRTSNFTGKAAAHIALHREPCAVLDFFARHGAGLIRDARQWLAAL